MTSILVLLSVSVLVSCSLAEEDPNYYYQTGNHDAKDSSDYYIPSGIEFSLRDSSGKEIDVSEFFYVNFNCPDMTVFDNCSSLDLGPSMESAGMSIHVYDETVNDVKQPTIEEMTIGITLYKSKDATFWISHRLVYMNIEGDTRYEGSHSTNFASGVSLSGTIETEEYDETKHILNYTIHYVGIDDLQMTTVKQFDENDVLIEEIGISKDEIVEEIILNENAAYYMIIEDYLDEDGALYQQREYHDSTETTYHLMMYTNDLGFLPGDYVIINQIEVPLYEVPVNE